MRRLAVALLGVVILVAAQAGAASARPDCAVARSKTLFENARARVFTRTYGADRDVRTQLCRKSDGRHFGLAHDVPDSSTHRVTLVGMRGAWLAYAVTVEGHSGLTTGDACRFDVPEGRRRCQPGLAIHGIGVTATGTLAWLAESGVDPNDDDTFCCTVYRLDRGARHAVQLDSGTDIDRDSFATAYHRAYWMKGGEPRSARLP